MKKEWCFILLLIFLAFGSLNEVNAEIGNISVEPQYPNLSSNLIKICADISNVSSTVLYYQITGDEEVNNNTNFSAPFFGKCAGIVNLNPRDNTIISYQILTFDSEGNITDISQSSNLTYDGSAPEISIIGDNPLTININSLYTELGATAEDAVYKDLTLRIIIEGNVYTTTIGEYLVNYTVSDLAGNTATATRIVNVVEPSSVTAFSDNNARGSGSGIISPNSNSGNNQITISNNSDIEKEAEENSQENTNSKRTITGKSIVELIGENKKVGILFLILIVVVIGAYYFIKTKIKRKLYGK